MQGLIVVHLFLLTFFVLKATSSITRWVTPRTPVTTDSSMRLSTYNLRYDSMPDNITVPQTIASLPNPITEPAAFLNITGEVPWSTRRIKAAQRVIGEEVQILGSLGFLANACAFLACWQRSHGSAS